MLIHGQHSLPIYANNKTQRCTNLCNILNKLLTFSVNICVEWSGILPPLLDLFESKADFPGLSFFSLSLLTFDLINNEILD